MEKTQRSSSFELLRILAMLMIIAHHLAVHSGYDWGQGIMANRLWILFLQEGGVTKQFIFH